MATFWKLIKFKPKMEPHPRKTGMAVQVIWRKYRFKSLKNHTIRIMRFIKVLNQFVYPTLLQPNGRETGLTSQFIKFQ